MGMGCLPRGAVSAHGRGVCPGAVSAQGGVSAWGCPPDSPVDRMTDACENITFPQLLFWTVNIELKRQVQ